MGGNALIFGVGGGISASVARLLAKENYKIGLVARNADKLADLASETKAHVYSGDVTKADEVARAFEAFENDAGAPDVVVYNPSARARGPITELDPEEVRHCLDVTAFGAFLVGQTAAKSMQPKKSGTIIFTGASAGVKGYPRSAPFAMGKFALRGLAQSMARELHPDGVHICHVVIDGGVRSGARPDDPDKPDSWLDPDAIADCYLHLIRQPRSTWSWEMEIRPWVENF
jgi:NAD(P)-dependent dehydrogenase (short-subunit alcohol dehydrogenase family)